jgi:hypothetical protein
MLTSAHHDLRFATRCLDAAQPSDDMKPIKVKFPSEGIALIPTGVSANYCEALGNDVAFSERMFFEDCRVTLSTSSLSESEPSRNCEQVGQPFFTRPVGRRKMQVDTSH